MGEEKQNFKIWQWGRNKTM